MKLGPWGERGIPSRIPDTGPEAPRPPAIAAGTACEESSKYLEKDEQLVSDHQPGESTEANQQGIGLKVGIWWTEGRKRVTLNFRQLRNAASRRSATSCHIVNVTILSSYLLFRHFEVSNRSACRFLILQYFLRLRSLTCSIRLVFR